MKIAITCANLVADSDGVSRVVHKTIEELKKQNVEMIAFSPAPPAKKDQIIPVYKVPSVRIPFYKEYRFALPIYGTFKKRLSAFKPDIIHIHSQDPLGLMAIIYAKQNNIPVVATYHTDYVRILKFYKLRILEGMTRQEVKFIQKNCDLIFCPSKDAAQRLEAQGFKNGVVLNHGVDTSIFNPQQASTKLRQKLKIHDKKIVLYAGRVVWEKGLKVLADAYKILGDRNDIVFLIAGRGAAKKELKKLMPKAKFLGQLDIRTLAQTYASSDIFVFTSTIETFGLVMLEAMACGLPVIGADVKCDRELIEENVNGFLFSPKSPQQLAKKIVGLATNDDLRHNMSQKAAAFAKTKPWGNIISQLLVYYDILAYHKNIDPITKKKKMSDLNPW